MLEFDVKIKGIAPLLFNRFPEEDNSENKSKGKKAILSKDDQVEKSLYKLEDGTLYHPSEHLVGAMIKAATSFKMEGKKSFKDVVKAGIFIEPLKIPYLLQKYVADWRSVVIPSTRGRVMKGRARMDEWELQFQLICLDLRATAQDIEEILKYAGSYVGIGDYRPRYGRFEVIEFSEVKN